MILKLNSTALNVLRVYATLMVFCCHSAIIGSEEFCLELDGGMHLLNTPAWGGVGIFFALGGFLSAYGFADCSIYVHDEKLQYST